MMNLEESASRPGEQAADQFSLFPDWRAKVVFSDEGPRPQVLHEDERVKVVVVGLEPSAQIPVHPAEEGVYHFVEGSGEMQLAAETVAVCSGATVIVPSGMPRGITATTRLALIAVRIASEA